MINAIVLAAGESLRMGKPKPLLRMGDRTFLEQVVTVLQEAHVDRITVVLGARAEVIAEVVDLSGVDLVVNEGYREGKFDYLNLLQAQSDLFDAKIKYIESLTHYHKAVSAIERLICEKLDNVIENNTSVQRSEKQ